MEGAQCREVGRHGVIREEASHDLRQPSSLLWNGLMHSPSQLLLDLRELRPHAITPGSPFEEELAPSRSTANVDEPQELEGLRFSEPAPSAFVRRMATKLDQAGLLRIERQRELLHPLAHRIVEAPGVRLVLEANDDVVGIAHNDHVAGGLAPSPAFGPEVEGVVQVDVGKQRRDHRALPRPAFTDRDDPVLQDARLQPFLDQADNARITDAVLNEPDQLFLADRVRKRTLRRRRV